MKLNIGSGHKRYDGFANIDDDTSCNPDYLIHLDDVNLVLPFEDNSIEEIRAYHILEHIGDGFIRLMQEMYRIMEPGAILDIKVPSPWSDVAIIDVTHRRPLLPESFRLFSKKFNQLEIERGGSSSTLGLKYNVDFELVSYYTVPDPFYDNILPQMSEAMIQRLSREALNLAVESHVKIMAVK